MAERLQKYLAGAGVASRRAAERLIAGGHVRVNGQVVDQVGALVEPEIDRVEVDGEWVRARPRRTYLAVNKPPGYVTTTSDPQRRPIVMALVPKIGRLYPVGRLDAESEGLLLLTDDGELANRVTHPRYGCEKEYHALVSGEPEEHLLDRLRHGIELAEGFTCPARVERVREERGGRVWMRVVLGEGRKRQVRRMFEAIGCTVERLIRVRIGPLELRGQPSGTARPLTRSEVAALYTATAVVVPPPAAGEPR
ncbi:MAG: rRNA pseudouridine synthase [Chloroflexi bacterium]|nr:rRNA pseudouridine synthase [Chloroflexota bacterium]